MSFHKTLRVANRCPHCMSLIGLSHHQGCEAGIGKVGLPDTATCHKYPDDVPVLFVHEKTGNHYYFIGVVTDCTNGQEDKLMAVYSAVDKVVQPFVRELSEFHERFKPVSIS